MWRIAFEHFISKTNTPHGAFVFRRVRMMFHRMMFLRQFAKCDFFVEIRFLSFSSS